MTYLQLEFIYWYCRSYLQVIGIVQIKIWIRCYNNHGVALLLKQNLRKQKLHIAKIFPLRKFTSSDQHFPIYITVIINNY